MAAPVAVIFRSETSFLRAVTALRFVGGLRGSRICLGLSLGGGGLALVEPLFELLNALIAALKSADLNIWSLLLLCLDCLLSVR